MPECEVTLYLHVALTHDRTPCWLRPCRFVGTYIVEHVGNKQGHGGPSATEHRTYLGD